MIEFWWPPRDIFFSSLQVVWLIKALEVLHEGTWPPDPTDSGYTESWEKPRSSHAYFEIPCQIAAEIDYRISRTGVDGKLLVAEVRAETIFLSEEAKTALNYISGWRRKRTLYIVWCRQRRYRQGRQ